MTGAQICGHPSRERAPRRNPRRLPCLPESFLPLQGDVAGTQVDPLRQRLPRCQLPVGEMKNMGRD